MTNRSNKTQFLRAAALIVIVKIAKMAKLAKIVKMAKMDKMGKQETQTSMEDCTWIVMEILCPFTLTSIYSDD